MALGTQPSHFPTASKYRSATNPPQSPVANRFPHALPGDGEGPAPHWPLPWPHWLTPSDRSYRLCHLLRFQRPRTSAMGAQPNSPAPPNAATTETEFEWLLCLAATLQARQLQERIQADEPRHTRPTFLNAMVRAWALRRRSGPPRVQLQFHLAPPSARVNSELSSAAAGRRPCRGALLRDQSASAPLR